MLGITVPPPGTPRNEALGAGEPPGEVEVAEDAELEEPAEDSSTEDREARNRWMYNSCGDGCCIAF